MELKLSQEFLTENDCYQAGRKIVPKGIMVHSTGVAQPDPQVWLIMARVPRISRLRAARWRLLMGSFRIMKAKKVTKTGLQLNRTATTEDSVKLMDI